MMKCEICWNYLHDAPDTSDEPPAKKSRSHTQKQKRKQSESEVVCTPCGHLFHRACLNNWFDRCGESYGTCPHCRKTIDKHVRSQLRSVYLPLDEDSSSDDTSAHCSCGNESCRERIETLVQEKKVLEDICSTEKARADLANQLLMDMLEEKKKTQENDDSRTSSISIKVRLEKDQGSQKADDDDDDSSDSSEDWFDVDDDLDD